MIRNFSRMACLAFMALTINFVSTTGQALADDVIDIDRTQVDSAALPTIDAAEKFWETRIVGYSTELPRHVREQLSSLTISAVVAPIDGPGGILGFAGPNAMISYSKTDPITGVEKTYVVAVQSAMTFDIDDFPEFQANGKLQSLVNHEMGHALGIGSLWAENGLVAEVVEGQPLMEYVGGQYAIESFGLESGNRFATLVPVEQRGGGGTALAHWTDTPPFFNQVFTPAFKKETMTGFLGDFDPITQKIVYATEFTAEATWGTLADLGFAVRGINDEFLASRGNGTGIWPKKTGPNIDPFQANGVAPGPGVQFRTTSYSIITKLSLGSKGKGVSGGTGDAKKTDPYNLRDHRWSK